MNERRVKGPYGLFLSHHSHNRSVRTLHTHVRRSIRFLFFNVGFMKVMTGTIMKEPIVSLPCHVAPSVTPFHVRQTKEGT